jgi:hypothetical protein
MRLALGRFGFGWFSLTGLVFAPTVLPLKFLNPAGGIDEFDFSSVEGVADRADFDVDLRPRAAGRKFVPAPADNGRFNIFGVNAVFHRIISYVWSTETAR